MPPVPEDPNRSVEVTLALADEYLAAGRPFAAHEVLEEAWKHRPDAERDLWQGLAQVAVGLTHLQRGNQTGAIALLRRGVDHLAGAVEVAVEVEVAAGFRAGGVARDASTIADLLAAGDPDAAIRARHLRLRS